MVGEAADVDGAVAAAERLLPDVVLLDLVMPGGGGVAALPRLLALSPPPRVIVLTSFGADDQALAAVRGRAPAAGSARTCRRASSSRPSAPCTAAAPCSTPRWPAACWPRSPTPGDTTPGLDQLTAREREVLALLGEGLSNKELAARLFVAEKTVKTHVSAVLSKLHLTDRTQAALFAVRHGLVGDPRVLGPAAEAQAASGPMASRRAVRTVGA